MGAILTGLGDLGSQIATAKLGSEQLKKDDALTKLEMLQKQLGLDEGQMRLKQMKQKIEADDLAEKMKTPEGIRSYLESVLGRKPTDIELRRFLNISAGNGGYTDVKVDKEGDMVGLNLESGMIEKIPTAPGQNVKITPTGVSGGKKDGEPVVLPGATKKVIGIYKDGHPMLPGDPNWTDSEQKMYDTLVKEQQSAEGQKPKTILSLIQAAQRGDSEAAQTVKTYYDNLKSVREAGYVAGAQARAKFQMGQYLDRDTNQLIPMSNFDAANEVKSGKNLILTGDLPMNVIIPAQRMVSESKPAIAGVRDNLSAFDDEHDRAIFARILAANAPAVAGSEAGWMGNILNQALRAGLSPKGQALVRNEARLADTVGTLRQTLGLPATDSMMGVTLNLIPGPGTPDSKYAQDQVNILENMISQAVQIPVLKGVTPTVKNNTQGSPVYQNGKIIGYQTDDQKKRGVMTPAGNQ